jgi:hypothetical protein
MYARACEETRIFRKYVFILWKIFVTRSGGADIIPVFAGSGGKGQKSVHGKFVTFE